ncbi:phosphoenolpyruvate carboxykinase (ATP) [Candidatus Gracilibacteria bacterium]|nr:phosphoenolpyruvate carboxykinase (ATP) [Candidatus Gracilibacteria bacterium]
MPIPKTNLSRQQLIQDVIDQHYAFVTPSGALATWNEVKSTGRSPADTFIVRHEESEKNIDWSSPTNLPLEAEVFDSLWEDALQILNNQENTYVADKVIGADSSYALPVKLITDNPLTTLFADNMFRPVPENIEESKLSNNAFTLLVLPHNKIKSKKYSSDMIIAVDFDRSLGLVYGSSYCGSVKKLMFTALNYLAPEHGILPLHCSANEGSDGSTAVILGLSGTGKTTLSADASRPLIGDDEHGWGDGGVANFENGCYAKLINLNPTKEPEIYRIAFGEKKDPQDSGVIIENAMMYPRGNFDLDDERITANSRVSYPMTALSNFKESGMGTHPKTILFLTADANGVLPPVAKLNEDQAMLWFLMGYTSKLAGTETGVTEPKTAFSRFFGGPFMSRNPNDYTHLLNTKIVQHKVNVYLINTGWSGGPYGVGARMDIGVTRAIVNACLNGDLENVNYTEDTRFHFSIPQSCPDVDSQILNPANTWTNTSDYETRAQKLAQEFSEALDKNFPDIDERIRRQCPGK